jgi:two-component system response regulator FixJ
MSIPEMSGLQVHRKILEAGSTATVIYISSNCERQNIVDAMKAGAVDFLWKPLSRETLAKAVAEAMSISVTAVKLIAQQARVRAGLEQLSVREREIFTMLVSGLPNRQIATRLGVRPDTVKKHRTVICEKFLVEDTAQLIAMTLERPIYHIS